MFLVFFFIDMRNEDHPKVCTAQTQRERNF